MHQHINQFQQMYLDKEKKAEIFSKYGKGTTDTGSAEAQIALFTYRIAHLTEHVKANHKDFVTTRSLTQLVGKRRRPHPYTLFMAPPLPLPHPGEGEITFKNYMHT